MDENELEFLNYLNNQTPEGIEKLKEDIVWWETFFGPAFEAYQRKDYKTLQDITERYQAFITDPMDKND